MLLLSFFDEHEIAIFRRLTDRGAEFCEKPDRHEYELFLVLNDIEHTKSKAKNPQTKGICERFHRTIHEEFYSIRKIYLNLEELQRDLDIWLEKYNKERAHQGKHCNGKTPMETFLEKLPLTKEKIYFEEEIFTV